MLDAQFIRDEFAMAEGGKFPTVTLHSSTSGGWFRYTLERTVPTRTRGYVYCGVISPPTGAVLKAVAYRSGMADSTVAELAAKK